MFYIFVEYAPVKREASGSLPEGGVGIGKDLLGLVESVNQNLILTVASQVYPDYVCIFLWLLHPIQLCLHKSSLSEM